MGQFIWKKYLSHNASYMYHHLTHFAFIVNGDKMDWNYAKFVHRKFVFYPGFVMKYPVSLLFGIDTTEKPYIRYAS